MFGIFRLTAVLHAVICLLDRNTVAWYPFSLIFLPFLSSFNTFIETLPVLFYLTICFFLSPCSWYHSGVVVRDPWLPTLWHDTYAVWDSSAFRDCFISFFLDRCRLLFVWLVFPLTGPRVLGITVVLYSEIATLWLDGHSVWDSSAFRARFISVMVLCHSRFLWRVCVPTGSRVLGITVVYLFENLGWSSLMFDMMFGNFRLTAVWLALICLLDRDTVAWWPLSLRFLCF